MREDAPGPDSRYADLAAIAFPHNQPSPQSTQRLRDELLFQRATQVYLWALPAVNLMAMKEASERQFGVGYHVLPVWKERLNAKTIVTTPNSDVIYAMGYVDVGQDGPLVIEIPPQQQGILNDFFQRPIPGPTVEGRAFAGDVGLAGPDGGQGGKFLLLPPGYDGDVPDGYYVYRPRTNNVFVFWRAFFADPADLAPPVHLIEQTRIYPLGQEHNATAMAFPDASGIPLDMDFPFDGSYFAMLARFIETEVVDPADLDWRGMLAGIGIVKGQPFQPDARSREILDAAAKTAIKMSRMLVYENLLDSPGGKAFPDRHYIEMSRNGAADFEWLESSGTYRDLDLREAIYSIGYSTSPAMGSKIPNQGARYLPAFKDADGDFLVGDASYRLHLPPDVPAANFWSVTLYDSLTAAGVDNGQPFPSIGSRDQPVTNDDGSIDLYFGPNAPAGKEGNWRRTSPGEGFFVMLRLYGPTQAYFDHQWTPDDLVKDAW